MIIGLGLLTWNGSRFVHAQARIRTKDLTFLPSPTTARLMCLGHVNTFAKLRWIDSFAYFEKQLDLKDDTVLRTGESTFERLYRMLVALDPKFLPYYQHASLNLGGVLSRHEVALSILEGGLLDLPHETQLWRMVAAEMSTTYKAETASISAMDGFLASWYDAETTDEGRQEVWDWKKAMGQRRYLELEQVPYWIEQLRRAPANSPTRAFVLRTLREQVARFGESRLQLLIDSYRAQRLIGPVMLPDLLAPEIVARAFPKGLPAFGPIQANLGGFSLRPDPFGFAYELDDGQPLSPGWQQLKIDKRLGMLSGRLVEVAKRDGRWPTTVAEAVAAGVVLDPLPKNGTWEINGQEIVVHWTPPPNPPWEP